MEQRLSALLLAFLVASCSGAPARPASPSPDAPHAARDAESASPPNGLAAYSGRYPGLTFELAHNDCGTEFSNSVTDLIVDADARQLYTVGEDRHYDARVEPDGELVAEAYFDADQTSGGLCEDARFHERWRLRLRAGGGLEGVVEGLWPIEPRCERPCRVSFSVRTRPSVGPGRVPARRAPSRDADDDSERAP